jgi:hypothetical protein
MDLIFNQTELLKLRNIENKYLVFTHFNGKKQYNAYKQEGMDNLYESSMKIR